MQIGKIKPVATIVAQFAAGVEVEAIQHEGKLFMPVTTMGEFATKESAPVDHEDAPESKPSKKSGKKESKSEATDEVQTYTEDELTDMDVKELKKILKGLEIDPDDFDGKNTNKKLRKLILDAQAEAGDADEDDDDDDEQEEEKSAKKSGKASKSKKDDDDEEEEDDDESDDSDDDLSDKVADILDEYDGGKINTKKATSKLAETLGGDKDAIAKMLDKFDDDEDGDISEWADKFVSKFAASDDDEDDEDDKPAKKRGKKDEDEDDDDDDLVEISELKKGDRVNIWWDDEDNKAWYKGTVKSVKGKKVTVAYDDDTEDVLDPEVHTQIKLIEE